MKQKKPVKNQIIKHHIHVVAPVTRTDKVPVFLLHTGQYAPPDPTTTVVDATPTKVGAGGGGAYMFC